MSDTIVYTQKSFSLFSLSRWWLMILFFDQMYIGVSLPFHVYMIPCSKVARRRPKFLPTVSQLHEELHQPFLCRDVVLEALREVWIS